MAINIMVSTWETGEEKKAFHTQDDKCSAAETLFSCCKGENAAAVK